MVVMAHDYNSSINVAIVALSIRNKATMAHNGQTQTQTQTLHLSPPETQVV